MDERLKLSDDPNGGGLCERRLTPPPPNLDAERELRNQQERHEAAEHYRKCLNSGAPQQDRHDLGFDLGALELGNLER